MRQPIRILVRRSFTLLELLVVITILSLLTATVTTRIADTLGPAALKESVSQFEFTDQLLRKQAFRTGKCVSLSCEIGGNHFEYARGGDETGSKVTRSLGHGVRISKYLSAAQDLTNGPLRISYDGRGATESFAIEFAGRRDSRQWLIIAGLTGQVIEVAEEASVRKTMEMVLPASVHAR